MPLIPGARLGPYEVLAPVGAGGMGEVYRARDTRLDRDVAIKVLPAAVAQDPERLARFEREAKVVASLNHSNIAQVYGVEFDGDTRAIVMELVAGSTLTVPQPLETALDYAQQIAEALEGAHEKGITHRDLKPANIMITPEGVVKVLDFGLATAPNRETGSDPATSPTFTMAATQAGIIMGTAGYMSPEQAAGKTVDRRSDIWSFGVVLWEMLTGARLFEGETVSHTLADVLRAPIEFDKLPPSTPAPIAELVKRCLDRNVKTRLQSIGEARIAIERYRKHPTSSPAPTPLAPRRTSWTPWALAGTLAAVAAGLGFVAYSHTPEAAPRTLRASLMPPEGTGFVVSSPPAISPDARKLAFTAVQDGKTSLWVRDLDSLSARNLPATAGASFPFWSPDSQSIAFFAEGKLKRIDVGGGAPIALCSTEASAFGGSWSSRGVILFPQAPTGGLYKAPAGGGTPTPVTTLNQASGDVSHRLPSFLPDGRRFLYSVRNQDQAGKSGIYVGDLDSNERILVLQGEYDAAYVPAGGFLVYATGGSLEGPLMVRRFDVSTMKVSGEPFPLVESVNQSIGIWASKQFSVALDGTLVYSAGGSLGGTQMTWVDRSGKKLGTVGEPAGALWTAAISPDGALVATSSSKSGSRDIWLHDLPRGVSSRFTFNTGDSPSIAPVWSADGKSLLYSQVQAFHAVGVMRKAVVGGGSPELVTTGWGEPVRGVGLLSTSRDGRYLVARVDPGGVTGVDLWMMRLDRPGEKPVPYLATRANENHPNLSPSGEWLAYSSDETRRSEVYIQSFPAQGRKYQVSVDGGGMPVWSRDAKELFFIAPDRKMMTVSINVKGAALEIGPPKPLFDSKIVPGNNCSFDVSKDGRFLIPRQEQESNAPWTVVVNWQPRFK